jgi:hypothetical protein
MSPEKAPVEKVKKARANISNLPKERLEQIRENNKSTAKAAPTTKAEDMILGPSDNLSTPAKLQGGKNKVPQRLFFVPWGYETLLEYSEDRRTREKLQDYEI